MVKLDVVFYQEVSALYCTVSDDVELFSEETFLCSSVEPAVKTQNNLQR